MQASAEKIWGAAQEQLRSMLSADTYNLWFAPLRACGLDNNHISLEVANDFCEVWLKDNYMGLLQDVLTLASGRQMQVRFKVASGSSITASVAEAARPQLRADYAASEKVVATQEPSFNPKNTFETFVVGNNNNFAYAAAQAVAQSPG